MVNTSNTVKIDEKKRDVTEKICEVAKDNAIVKRVIVFGSAANGTCTSKSDIDVCFDINCTTRDLRVYDLNVAVNKVCDYNCDIFFYNYLGDHLKEEIDRTGVTVYEA